MVNYDPLIHPKGSSKRTEHYLKGQREADIQNKEAEKTLVIRQATKEERKRFGIK